MKKEYLIPTLTLEEAMKIEQNELLKKITKARENSDMGTYKNLILALKEVTRLLKDEIRESERLVKDLYFESNIGEVVICFDGKMTTYRGYNNNMIAKIVKNMISTSVVKVYGNIAGVGVALADEFAKVGIIVNDTDVEYNREGNIQVLRQSYETTRIVKK